MNILCLIPAYNEEGNLQVLTDRLIRALRTADVSFSILYVLQGSKKSIAVLQGAQKKYPDVRIHHLWYEHPLGIGRAYQKGFSRIPRSCTHILTMDGDLNHDPADITKFIKEMEQTDADIVIGSRFIPQGQFGEKRRWKRIVSRLVNTMITTTLRLPVHDVSSGYRLMKRTAVDRVRPSLKERGYPSYMEFVICAYKKGLRLREVPIIYTPRTWGKSKLTIRDTLFNYLVFLPRVLRGF